MRAESTLHYCILIYLIKVLRAVGTLAFLSYRTPHCAPCGGWNCSHAVATPIPAGLSVGLIGFRASGTHYLFGIKRLLILMRLHWLLRVLF